MKKEKISDEQFILDCINKEFEIIESPLQWRSFDDLREWAKDNRHWFDENKFSSKEQFKLWHDYFINHFYDWKPKYLYNKRRVEEEFSGFNLEYGFSIKET